LTSCHAAEIVVTFERAANAWAARTRAHELAGLMRPVDELNLSLRSCNGLKARDIGLVGDLIPHTETELLRTPHQGRTSLQEIKHSLSAMGLTLGTRVPGWAPPPA
jgi:DNA-directed RNA polymerase subunit alpha